MLQLFLVLINQAHESGSDAYQHLPVRAQHQHAVTYAFIAIAIVFDLFQTLDCFFPIGLCTTGKYALGDITFEESFDDVKADAFIPARHKRDTCHSDLEEL